MTSQRLCDNLRMIDEMNTHSFTTFSEAPLLLTHRADMGMHMHMTCAAFPFVYRDKLAHAVDKALDFTHGDRPLVLDIGSGRGSFLLALAVRDTPIRAVNYLGLERSPFLVAKASGMAKRLGVDGHVRFVSGPVEDILTHLLERQNRPRVSTACFMFPTPFAATREENVPRSTAKINTSTKTNISNTSTSTTNANNNNTTNTNHTTNNGGDGDNNNTNNTTNNNNNVNTDDVINDNVNTNNNTTTTTTNNNTNNTTINAQNPIEASLLSDQHTRNPHLPTENEFIISEAVINKLATLLEDGGGIFVQSIQQEICVWSHAQLSRHPHLFNWCPPVQSDVLSEHTKIHNHNHTDTAATNNNTNNNINNNGNTDNTNTNNNTTTATTDNNTHTDTTINTNTNDVNTNTDTNTNTNTNTTTNTNTDTNTDTNTNNNTNKNHLCHWNIPGFGPMSTTSTTTYPSTTTSPSTSTTTSTSPSTSPSTSTTTSTPTSTPTTSTSSQSLCDVTVNTARTHRTRRAQEWSEHGGGDLEEKAWLPFNPWSERCGARSESEVYYEHQQAHIFRIIFAKKHIIET